MSSGLSDLSFVQLKESRDVLTRWSIKTNDRTAHQYRSMLASFLDQYRLLIRMLSREIWHELEEKFPWLYHHPTLRGEVLASSSSALIGLIMYRTMIGHLRRPGREKEDQELDHWLVLLYLGSDYILDDPEIDDQVKREMKDKVREVFKETLSERIKVEGSIEDHRVLALIKLLYDILEREPLSRQGLLMAWKSELRSEQQKSETDIDKLWDISGDKGYKTVLMACHIINSGQDLSGSRVLGAVTQHVDDLMDHLSDHKAGINTAAVRAIYHEHRDWSLDRYIHRLLREIDSLDIDLWPLKIFFVQVTCSCGFHNRATSEEFRQLLRAYLLDENICHFEQFIKLLGAEENVPSGWTM